jgi:hypothetical protein
MRHKFMIYSLVVTLFCSLASWTGLAQRAGGGSGSGNSWHSWTSGAGSGGWHGGGGGHK